MVKPDPMMSTPASLQLASSLGDVDTISKFAPAWEQQLNDVGVPVTTA